MRNELEISGALDKDTPHARVHKSGSRRGRPGGCHILDRRDVGVAGVVDDDVEPSERGHGGDDRGASRTVWAAARLGIPRSTLESKIRSLRVDKRLLTRIPKSASRDSNLHDQSDLKRLDPR